MNNSAKADNVLFGKSIVFDGDSICHATSETNETINRGWAWRIGEKNSMQWYNYGISGGTITAEMYAASTGNARHWVSRSIDRIREKHERIDYLVFEGGTNDADLLGIGSEKFGEIDPTDYSGNFDDTTFTGALESLFYKAITYYPEAKIGFIVAQKMGTSPLGYGADNKRRHYFNRVIEVCRKWGVPYVDLWDGCILNPKLLCYYDKDLTPTENKEQGKAYADGQHLTGKGYDIVSPIIEAFLRTL